MRPPIFQSRAEWTAIAKRLIRGTASRAHVEGAAVGVEMATNRLWLWMQSEEAPKMSKRAHKAIRHQMLEQRRRWGTDPEVRGTE